MNSSTPYVTFDWLIASESSSSTRNTSDVAWVEAPFTKDIGYGGFESWGLAMDMVVTHSRYQFTREIAGQLVPLATINMSFSEPTLMVQTLLKGRVIQNDNLSPRDLVYGDGVDLFRYCDQASITPVMDTSQEIENVTLMIGQSRLSDLIGKELAQTLIQKLDLFPMPKSVVKPVPAYVQHSLHNCLSSQYSPALKKLWSQARILDYITNLSDYFCNQKRETLGTEKQNRDRVRAIHEYLVNLDGKLPTIEALAIQFGRSARALNEEFTIEYGESIFSFIVTHRLNSAYAAIRNTSIPLKQISEKLGYAHVNHFSAAFKKKFGHPPSKLRKLT
jgi:AraC-like DNA-binding protein